MPQPRLHPTQDTVVVSARVPASTAASIDRGAKALGVTRAEMIRLLLDRAVAG